MREISISANEAGQRLDKYLTKYLNKAPKSFIYKMLRKKNIKLNNKKAEGKEQLNLGDSVQLFLSEDTINEFTVEKKIEKISTGYELDIIYKDEDILIINKPIGMLSQRAEKTDISVNEYVLSYVQENKILTAEQMRSFKPAVCNRLDRNTSGIIVAGISLKGLQVMSQLLKMRELDKYYLCIVKGEISQKQKIEGYLKKEEESNKVELFAKPMPETVYIQTEYETIITNGKYTLLKVKLITGRSHQIRAHLASIGHAVIGDYKYGDRKSNDIFKNKYGLKYQLLHSYELHFPEVVEDLSQISNKTIIAPLPKLFEKIKNDLFGGK